MTALPLVVVFAFGLSANAQQRIASFRKASPDTDIFFPILQPALATILSMMRRKRSAEHLLTGDL